MSFKQIKIISIGIIIACLMHLFSNFICVMDKDYQTKHVSPFGKEVIISYDFVGRPTVTYKKNKLWSYDGSGFMEILNFNVVWINENEILIIQEDLNIQETIFIS